MLLTSNPAPQKVFRIYMSKVDTVDHDMLDCQWEFASHCLVLNFVVNFVYRSVQKMLRKMIEWIHY